MNNFKSLLKVENINKTFPGVKALVNVNFELLRGEVHVLAGENGAGKSTLIKIISGAYHKDLGKIFINGKEVMINSVKIAQKMGISTIYQELDLVPELNIAQNVFLGREPLRKGIFHFMVDKRALSEKTLEIFSRLGSKVSPVSLFSELTTPEKQIVAIAKALLLNAQIVIFDEPTATLSKKEIDSLFHIIRVLKKHGVGIIYISHRLEEIWEIGDRVTVLRDGKYIGTSKVEKITMNNLIKMIVGRELKNIYPRHYREVGEVALETRKISSKGFLHDINIKVHKGEIAGIAGLVGSGRTELAEVIFGINKADSGEIILFGKREIIDSPLKAVKLGIGFVTEDRKTIGVFQKLSVKDNIIIAALKRLFPSGIVNDIVACDTAQRYMDNLKIQTPNMARLVKYLSGGNQQKVVVAKWLATQAKILILDEPTRGIDIGAKLEMHRLIDILAGEGVSIIMISSELPEILGMSDRVYVMRKGKISAEYTRFEATQEKILRSALGIK